MCAYVTRDLRYAKIYVSVLKGRGPRAHDGSAEKGGGLCTPAELGRRMIIRYAPEILFERTITSSTASILPDVLKKVQAEESPHENG